MAGTAAVDSGGRRVAAGAGALDDDLLRRLTGCDRARFVRLVAEAEAAWTAQRVEVAANRPVGRGVGGGRRFSLPFSCRLFLAVLHVRWSVPYRGLGAMLDLGRATIERAARDLEPLLADVDLSDAVPPHQRGSRLLAAELERWGPDRRRLLDAIAEIAPITTTPGGTP